MSPLTAERRVRVGLARTRPDYGGLAAPFSPDRLYPELQELLGAAAEDVAEGSNHVYSAVRGALAGAGRPAGAGGCATVRRGALLRLYVVC